jgi:hypothetical protein
VQATFDIFYFFKSKIAVILNEFTIFSVDTSYSLRPEHKYAYPRDLYDQNVNFSCETSRYCSSSSPPASYSDGESRHSDSLWNLNYSHSDSSCKWLSWLFLSSAFSVHFSVSMLLLWKSLCPPRCSGFDLMHEYSWLYNTHAVHRLLPIRNLRHNLKVASFVVELTHTKASPFL